MVCALKSSDIGISLLSCCFFLSASAAVSQEIRIDARSSASSSVTITAPQGDNQLIDARSSASSSVTITAPQGDSQRQREPSNNAYAPKRHQAPKPTPFMAPSGGANQPDPGLGSLPPSAILQQPPKRPPLPCKRTVEVVDEDVKIKVINNYCSAQILNLSTWRESGKTYLQFEVDNSKGGPQAHLRLAEQWTDRRGRVIGDLIDEQRIAIESKKNKTVVLSGPTPAAMMATITLFK